MTSKYDDDTIAFVGLPEIAVTIEDDIIISDVFDDIYFNRAQGLQESEYVFCEGTKLADLLRERDHITIAETGFGTGLNFLAVQALRNAINPACQIDYISFEICPLTADIITIAHRPYASIHAASSRLCKALPPRWPGYHKVVMDEGGTHLHLYYGDANKLMTGLSFKADIWFLDGFNPAKNDSLWHEALFANISRLSADDARLATFTAAGFVKRGLIQAGFDVEMQKGFGKKRDMITAHKAGNAMKKATRPQSAIIIGGGIAGASIAYALHKRNITPIILEQGDTLASGASGNGAAMISARLRVLNDEAGRLSVACLSYARRIAEQAGVILHEGAVTINNRDKDQKRLDKLAQAGWPADLFQALDANEVASRLNLPEVKAGEYQPASAVINPAAFTNYMGQHAEIITNCQASKITKTEQGCEVITHTGKCLSAEMVFMASGADLPSLLASSQLPEIQCQISAGQVSYWPVPTQLSSTNLSVNYGGYMTPSIQGYQYFGASFNRDGQTEVTQEGHLHNIELLPEAWRKMAPDVKKAEGRLSYRLSTKDRMPLCGALSDGLYLLCGLGARGMTNGPLLGDMLVSKALGYPIGLDDATAKALQVENAFAKQ